MLEREKELARRRVESGVALCEVFRVEFAPDEIRPGEVRGDSGGLTSHHRVEHYPPRPELAEEPLVEFHGLLRRVNLPGRPVVEAEERRGLVEGSPRHFPLGEVFPRLALVPADHAPRRR